MLQEPHLARAAGVIWSQAGIHKRSSQNVAAGNAVSAHSNNQAYVSAALYACVPSNNIPYLSERIFQWGQQTPFVDIIHFYNHRSSIFRYKNNVTLLYVESFSLNVIQFTKRLFIFWFWFYKKSFYHYYYYHYYF